MEKKILITISREFGSGGRRIGERVAEELGIAFYDKKLINIVAEKSGLSMDFIKDHEQKINNSFLFNIAVGGYYAGHAFNSENLIPEDRLFLTQTKIIKELAEKESCVIVGRCADYILRDTPDCINVFLYSDMEDRVKRAVEEYGVPAETAQAELKKKDRARNNHYTHYTGEKWGDIHNYHLAAHTDYLGADIVVKLITKLAKHGVR